MGSAMPQWILPPPPIANVLILTAWIASIQQHIDSSHDPSGSPSGCKFLFVFFDYVVAWGWSPGYFILTVREGRIEKTLRNGAGK
jgi:hypothetical protein